MGACLPNFFRSRKFDIVRLKCFITPFHHCKTRQTEVPASFRQASTSSSKSSTLSPPRPFFSQPKSSCCLQRRTLTKMSTPTNEKLVARVTDSLEKPALDPRCYRIIRLRNQLEVLLIHDAKTDKASAALDVNVGSFSDAPDMPGLAHAVEHMLFMGTEKYPQENAYSEYLSTHNGYSNAFTAPCSTNYYFEVAAAPHTPANSQASTPIDQFKQLTLDSILYGALDRFAQFFIKPLFLENTLERELRAVDSENKKNLQADTWRLHQLSSSLSHPDHPCNHFSTGNYSTLHDIPLSKGVNLRERFIGFYETHYSANRMKLVVLGRESLDTLQSWVVELFSDIENKNLPQNRWDNAQLFPDDGLYKRYFAKPVADSRHLTLFFPYPDETEKYASHPAHYLSHLIGHEGPGSILQYLKEKGWADGLSAGRRELCPGSGHFDISVGLTEAGLTHHEEIVKIIFQYIALLNDAPPQQWIFEELKNTGEVDFRFRQNGKPSKTVSGLSGIMQKPYPRDILLSAEVTMREFDPEAIQKGLACLRPDNVRIGIVSQSYPGSWDRKEKWYGTEYKYEAWPKSFQEEVHRAAESKAADRPKELHLPHKNEFIPTRLDVDKKDVLIPARAPKLIRNDDFVRIWYKKDDQWWLPKAYVTITLRSPLVDVTARTGVLTQLYHNLVKDSLNDYAYDAEIAGLNYSLTTSSLGGLQIHVAGYNDKMAVLLEKVLLAVRDLEVKEDRFNIIKERAVRACKNFHYESPFNQMEHYKSWLTTEDNYIHDQFAAELVTITRDEVQAFFPQILRQLHLEVVAHGNLTKEDARNMTELVESILRPRGLPQSQWQVNRSVIVPPGSNYVFKQPLGDPDNINNCIDCTLMIGNNQDRPLRARALLAAALAEEPCFDQLRTKEQLGYVVFSGNTLSASWLSYRILVQSEKAPDYLEQRIELFLSQFGEILRNMEEGKFEKHKAGLCSGLLEQPKNLKEESFTFLRRILAETFDFESPMTDVSEVVKLTKADLIEFYDYYMSPASPNRAKLSVHLCAKTSPEEVAASLSTAEQIEKLSGSISELLGKLNLLVDKDKLQLRFTKIDFEKHDEDAIVGVVGQYLQQELAVPQNAVEQILTEGKPLIASILATIGINAKPAETGETVKVATGDPTLITNVRLFRSSMKACSSQQPVKDIKEFEDIEPKL